MKMRIPENPPQGKVLGDFDTDEDKNKLTWVCSDMCCLFICATICCTTHKCNCCRVKVAVLLFAIEFLCSVHCLSCLEFH